MLLTYQGLYTNTCGSGGSRLPAIGVQLRDRFVNIGPSNLGSANQPALQVSIRVGKVRVFERLDL